ncbi:hypothetical protein HHE06_15660 [Helicobacter heilmannii]|nr:hypothetical protein HHE06_15660 [Helicobacter heilmannii]
MFFSNLYVLWVWCAKTFINSPFTRAALALLKPKNFKTIFKHKNPSPSTPLKT